MIAQPSTSLYKGPLITLITFNKTYRPMTRTRKKMTRARRQSTSRAPAPARLPSPGGRTRLRMRPTAVLLSRRGELRQLRSAWLKPKERRLPNFSVPPRRKRPRVEADAEGHAAGHVAGHAADVVAGAPGAERGDAAIKIETSNMWQYSINPYMIV